MAYQRLRAPNRDGALLEVPPLAEASRHLSENSRRFSSWDHDFQGRRFDRLRAMARTRVIKLARSFLEENGLDVPAVTDPTAPIVVTGHQPELFHPGVWVKNFAASAVAGRVSGLALNLLVDNDLPKGPEIRVPHRHGDQVGLTTVAYDTWATDAPFEDLRVADEQLFSSFGGRVRRLLGSIVPAPLIESYWPRVVGFGDRTDRVALRLALARRSVEQDWGARNLEVGLGRLCDDEPFHWFVSHILANLDRFQRIHNDALRAYRQAHRIRSRNHPVADLGRQGDWLESPFWAWRADAPRRRPLLIRQLARTMELRIGGESDPLIELPLASDREACCAVERLNELAGLGVRLRTRALTTTMYARLLLGDLFIHGIGGAKYDELGDEIIRGFFGFEPPAFLTLSLTLWLGLETDPAAGSAWKASGRLVRDLAFNPDRYLQEADDPEVRDLIAAKRAAIDWPVETHRQREARFRELRRVNSLLIPHASAFRDRALNDRGEIARRLQQDATARSREYSFVLHDADRLRGAMTAVRNAVD